MFQNRWPAFAGEIGARTTLHSIDALALGTNLANANSSTAWAAANLALFCPVITDHAMTVAKLFCQNGATVSGNIDVGLYSADGTRLASSGSTAQAGVSVLQIFDVTDLTIGPGLYYVGLALDNTTGTIQNQNLSINLLKIVGLAEQTSAFPLPAIATFATLASASICPVVGLTGHTVV